jgi:hypothetical protein
MFDRTSCGSRRCYQAKRKSAHRYHSSRAGPSPCFVWWQNHVGCQGCVSTKTPALESINMLSSGSMSEPSCRWRREIVACSHGQGVDAPRMYAGARNGRAGSRSPQVNAGLFRRAGRRHGGGRPSGCARRKPARQHVESRREDQPKYRHPDHAGKHRCSEGLPQFRTGADTPNQR